MTRAAILGRGLPRVRVRRAMVVAHRWMGLAMAAFLVLLGATGSLIAFNEEIEAWISPQLFSVAPPYPGAPLLDPFVVRDRVLAQISGVQANWVELTPHADRSMLFGLDAAPGATAPLANDQIFADPYTGQVLGARSEADISQGWKNLMPFVYALHMSLALGDVGTFALGSAALLWSIDCFVGFYLTLPARRESRRHAQLSHRSASQWRARWATAWKVRWSRAASKLIFDLHRAGGLWTWIMLFVLAWSGVGFNLGVVYRPVMHALGGYVAPARADAAGPGRHVSVQTPIGWTEARQIAKDAMTGAAARGGFVVRRERLIHHDAAHGVYEYRVSSTLDVGEKGGNTTLFLDDSTGAVLRLDLPTGRHPGNTIDTWLSSLHTAAWGGVTMQIIVCLIGMASVMLSVTGVWIWWRRRCARVEHGRRP